MISVACNSDLIFLPICMKFLYLLCYSDKLYQRIVPQNFNQKEPFDFRTCKTPQFFILRFQQKDPSKLVVLIGWGNDFAMLSVANVIKIIEFWLRLATFLHYPLKSALLFVLHNKGNRTDYVGLPEKEEDLYNELSRKRGDINKLVRKRVLGKAELDILLPPGKNKTDSDTFDVTLIIVLITNFTTLPPPKNGWSGKIDPTDVSIAAFVLLARKWRNVLIHGTEPGNLLKADFDKKWLEGENIVKGLGLTTIDTNKLKNIDLDPRNSLVLNSLFIYIKKIQGSLDTHDKELALIQGDLANVKIDITSLKTKLDEANNKEQIDELKKQIEAIKKELRSKQDQENVKRHQGSFYNMR